MIAVDWGTTRVRAWRLADDGRILDHRTLDAGVMVIVRDEFAPTLESIIGAWCADGDGPVLLCGMVGGRQGWVEVPYIRCPASLGEIAAGMRELQWARGTAYIVPGLACHDRGGVPDLLRGEETQALGAMALLPPGAASLCLPGTHSKHVSVRDDRIEAFETYMTGEIYALLLEHSILGRLAESRDVDSVAFASGVKLSSEGGALSHQVFAARTRALTGELAPAAVAGYLSGLLVGHELANLPACSVVHVAGESPLRELYMKALVLTGREARSLGPDVAAVGMHRLAQFLLTSVAA